MSLDFGDEPRIPATRLSFLSGLSSLSLSRSPFSEIRSDLDFGQTAASRSVASLFFGFSLFVDTFSLLCGNQIRRFPFRRLLLLCRCLSYPVQHLDPSLPFRRHLSFRRRLSSPLWHPDPPLPLLSTSPSSSTTGSISFVSFLDFGESFTRSRTTRSIYCCFLHHRLPQDVGPLSLQQLAKSDQPSPVFGDIRAVFP